MTTRNDQGKVDFGFQFGHGTGEGSPRENRPFRILVMGDFSGRENKGMCEPVTGRRPRPVDCDSLPERLQNSQAALSIPFGPADGDRIELAFGELEDFHPDAMYARVEVFGELKKLRDDLLDPARFAAAARTVRESLLAEGPPPAPSEAETSEPVSAPQDDEDLFGSLLDKKVSTPDRPAHIRSADSRIETLIKSLVGPDIVAAPDPRQEEMVAAVDEAISEQMRRLLHHPGFQGLESVWTGLDFLTRNIETDEDLEIHMMDISQAELTLDLAADDPEETALYRLLYEESRGTAGGVPWTMVVGLYTYGAGEEDVSLLERVGRLCGKAQAPFFARVGHADGTGKLDLAAWQRLRGSDAADFLVMASPRFLLRLPYGPDAEPLEAFDFTEMPAPHVHEHYLWGHPALVCGCMLAQAYAEQGWSFTPGAVSEIDGLPLHMHDADGGREMTPCAEYWTTDRQAEDLIEHGVTPLLSIKGRDALLVPRFQSVSGKLLQFR